MKLRRLIIAALAMIMVFSFVNYYYMRKNYYANMEEEKFILLYELSIDSVLESKLSYEYEYIAIDLDSFTLIKSDEAKAELINYTKKYNSKVFASSLEDLKSNSYWNEDIASLDGVLITSSNTEIKWTGINLKVTAFVSNLSSTSNKLKSTYTNNTWKLKITKKSIS